MLNSRAVIKLFTTSQLLLMFDCCPIRHSRRRNSFL